VSNSYISTTCTNYRKAGLLALFLCFCISVFSQTDFRPGYYITWKNDTVNGLVDYRGEVRNSAICEFKENKNSSVVKINPSEIKAYRFIDSKYYISRKIAIDGNEEQVFLEFLVDGITDLYYYASLKRSFYLIEDKNGNLLELDNETKPQYVEGKGYIIKKNYQYIGLLKTAMGDCMEIQDDIDKVKLDHESLINITKEYHDYVCDGEQCIIYEKELPAIKIRFAPVAGINLLQLSYDRELFSNFDFGNTSAPFFGFLINTTLPRFNEKLSLDLGCNVSKSNIYGYYETGDKNSTYYYDAYSDVISIHPYFGFKYTFPKGKIRPALSTGILSNILFSSNNKLILEKEYESYVETIETNDFEPPKTIMGIYMQAGFNFYLLKNNPMFFNFTYSFSNQLRKEIKSSINSFGFSTGFYIK